MKRHLRVWLTHWGRVMHICVGKVTIIGSDNGLSPGRRQAIIRTNAGILLIGTLGTNFSEILSEIHTFSFKKMHLKMSSGRWRPFCLGLNVLNHFSSSALWGWRGIVVPLVGGQVYSAGSRVCRRHIISETAGRIFSIQSTMICLDPKFCNAMVICPFTHMGLFIGQTRVKSDTSGSRHSGWNTKLLSCWMDWMTVTLSQGRKCGTD